jgi:hypothetical protein
MKGIENESLQLPSQILEAVLPRRCTRSSRT